MFSYLSPNCPGSSGLMSSLLRGVRKERMTFGPFAERLDSPAQRRAVGMIGAKVGTSTYFSVLFAGSVLCEARITEPLAPEGWAARGRLCALLEGVRTSGGYATPRGTPFFSTGHLAGETEGPPVRITSGGAHNLQGCAHPLALRTPVHRGSGEGEKNLGLTVPPRRGRAGPRGSRVAPRSGRSRPGPRC